VPDRRLQQDRGAFHGRVEPVQESLFWISSDPAARGGDSMTSHAPRRFNERSQAAVHDMQADVAIGRVPERFRHGADDLEAQ
jgi:hypothetical protein